MRMEVAKVVGIHPEYPVSTAQYRHSSTGHYPHFLVFHYPKLLKVSNTWYLFWCHLCWSFKCAEVIPKGDVKTLQTTDWPERIVTITASLLWQEILNKPEPDTKRGVESGRVQLRWDSAMQCKRAINRQHCSWWDFIICWRKGELQLYFVLLNYKVRLWVVKGWHVQKKNPWCIWKNMDA